MTITQILHQIIGDKLLETMLAALALDFVLGVLAALKSGTFQLAYLANFTRNDVLGKVAPWSVLEAFAVVDGGFNVVIPGADLSNIAAAAGAVIVAALVGSILGSLKDLGLLAALPPTLGSGR